MPRNYGIGSRNMAVAGRMVLKRKFHGGYQSIYDLGQRFGFFCAWISENHGIKKMENVTFELVVAYGQHLQSELDAGLRKSSSAPKSYVSAVNTVMKLATLNRWKTVRPGSDCGISRCNYIPDESKAMTSATHQTAQRVVGERIACLMEMQRFFGLRFKESCLVSPKQALKDVQKQGYITLKAGTKGGKKRNVPCRPGGIAILEKAASFQDGRSMVPKSMLYVQFRTECYAQAKLAGIGFHGERHYYAQSRYTEITGAPAPVHVGWPRRGRIKNLAEFLGVSEDDAKKIDSEARLEISIALGHNREDVTNAYLG
jgi:Integrase